MFLVFLIYVGVRAIINKEFRIKLQTQLSNINYFSFIPVFLAILGVSTWSMFFLPDAELVVLLGILGIPILFIAGVIAVIISSLKNRNSFDKLMSIITFVIIALSIVGSIVILILSVISRNYYDLEYKKLKEDRPVCSEEFIKAEKDALLIGNYNFCQNAFIEYGYSTTKYMGNNTSVGETSCRRNGEIFNVADCMEEMINSPFDKLIPYCEKKTNCKDKLGCYFTLNKINLDSLNKNINPDGSMCK